VRDLEATYHHPVTVLDCENRPVILPSFESVGTVILREVAALPLAEQQVLSDWLSRANGRTQVVTASSVALFPLVESGVFQTTLYYRLNVVYIDVTASPSTIESAS
jgi:transcriptional regulator of aromatic amino acid metabolism